MFTKCIEISQILYRLHGMYLSIIITKMHALPPIKCGASDGAALFLTRNVGFEL